MNFHMKRKLGRDDGVDGKDTHYGNHQASSRSKY